MTSPKSKERGSAGLLVRPKSHSRKSDKDGSELARRSEYVVSTLGNAKTAELLEVSPSQPSRWRRSEELPSAGVAPFLVDLDYITGRLRLLWAPEVVSAWLEGPNPHLEGARPIDVLRNDGPKPVIEAIEAEAEWSFA